MNAEADTIVHVPSDELRTVARQAFVAVGVSEEEAKRAGDILWTAERMGLTTHGVRRIIFYVQRVHDGAINPTASIKVERTAPSMAVIDGDRGLGPIVGARGVDEAIAMARETGIGYVACRNSHHFGPVAPYALQATEAGMVAFMGTNAQPVMAPWLGKQLAHGNNPIALASPRRNGPPFILDIAQSVVAFSKLRHAKEAGHDLPPGWAADNEGRPTTDPSAGLEGWVLPIGGHKGYGLALAVDILAGALAGGAVASEVRSLYARDAQSQGVCHFFLVIDPERLIGREAFLDRVDTLCALMNATPSVDPADPVLIPGEPEAASMRRCDEEGIPLPIDRYRELQSMAQGGVPQSMPDR